MTALDEKEARLVRRAVLQLNAQAWGVAFGLLFGLGLFVATVVLVMKGGQQVGTHLGLLSAYLPGYRVTIGGAFLGFIYLFVIGYAFGRLVGVVYNWIAKPAP